MPEFREQASRAIDWIVRNRAGDGSFGSTQATVLALKALVEHAKANRKTLTSGELIVKHGDQVLGSQQFGADEVNTIKLGGFEGQLRAGENKLAISLTGDNEMPYTIDVSYRAQKPHSDPDCAVEVSTNLASAELKAGQTVALHAELANKTDQGQPMTVAILGLPAGLQPRADQLEELKKNGTIDYYETRAREVICYWRSLAPKKRIPLKLDLVAEWPGKYTGPASRAYLYYTAERKHWAEPLSVTIERVAPSIRSVVPAARLSRGPRTACQRVVFVIRTSPFVISHISPSPLHRANPCAILTVSRRFAAPQPGESRRDASLAGH